MKLRSAAIDYTTKEDVLIEALPYIQKYEGTTFVIKYGGAAMTDPVLKSTFAKDVTILRKIGINIVIVHGGGKDVTAMAAKLGIGTRFVNGQRYTDDQVASNRARVFSFWEKYPEPTIIDTTNMTVAQVVKRILQVVLFDEYREIEFQDVCASKTK